MDSDAKDRPVKRNKVPSGKRGGARARGGRGRTKSHLPRDTKSTRNVQDNRAAQAEQDFDYVPQSIKQGLVKGNKKDDEEEKEDEEKNEVTSQESTRKMMRRKRKTKKRMR
eukprot:TRINITY_DN778_c1_g1_i2.p1 TRINITY_DN778_c1_g1~~TRINITY_DN778_c1_g1_i2.p1  ORF type:complete len:119 (-),score=18.70 TRINITY_DN778_c1_g1_i2:15-347(-)